MTTFRLAIAFVFWPQMGCSGLIGHIALTRGGSCMGADSLVRMAWSFILGGLFLQKAS